MRVAIAHDYLTQRGGAERVALELARAFPEAPLYTMLYAPEQTYEGFRHVDVRPVRWLNSIKPLRADARRALPLIPVALATMPSIEADVVLCSSSGWGHAFETRGVKVVYCHNPARWLYQPDAYFAGLPTGVRAVVSRLLAPLRSLDKKAAASCDRYIANSANVAARVRSTYGRGADVLHPPRGLDPSEHLDPVPGVEPGFYLTVSRRRGYKRSRDIAGALGTAPRRLVQVGGEAPGDSEGVLHLTGISDANLRWLYANCRALVAVGDEDFGLTPVEAYAFGRPAIVLAAGGYLETASDQSTVLVPTTHPEAIRAAADEVEARVWDKDAIRAHGRRWSPQTFRHGLQQAVEAAQYERAA